MGPHKDNNVKHYFDTEQDIYFVSNIFIYFYCYAVFFKKAGSSITLFGNQSYQHLFVFPCRQ